ncbi:MAG: hypothetical protein V7L00_11700 [Nostoc sp.]|uniref:hypothetical protein n=1 Tax=Nostoc sp. TaxID=1180 RepID=UPI002FF948EF
MSITWIATIIVIEYCLNELKLISHYLSDRGDNIIKAAIAKSSLKIILKDRSGSPTYAVIFGVNPSVLGYSSPCH